MTLIHSLQLASIPGLDDIKEASASSAQEFTPQQESVPLQSTENPPENSDEPVNTEPPITDPNIVAVKNDTRSVRRYQICRYEVKYLFTDIPFAFCVVYLSRISIV